MQGPKQKLEPFPETKWGLSTMVFAGLRQERRDLSVPRILRVYTRQLVHEELLEGVKSPRACTR